MTPNHPDTDSHLRVRGLPLHEGSVINVHIVGDLPEVDHFVGIALDSTLAVGCHLPRLCTCATIQIKGPRGVFISTLRTTPVDAP